MKIHNSANLLKVFLLSSICFIAGPVSSYSNNISGRLTKIKVTNPLETDRKDEVIPISVDKLKKSNPEFNENAFVVFDGDLQIPSQTEDINGDGKAENIVLLIDLKSKESKTIVIESDKTAVLKSEYKKRTHAELSAKVEYKLENGVYSGGRFKDIKETEVPQNHFAHDALYKFEGPGWESDRVAYRFYLDSRNRNDIFGKKTDKVVLSEVGQNDLVSDSKESYTQMCEWGMDIFKVGESLGLGSIGMISDGKVNTVSKTDKVMCKITTDGPVRSDVLTYYQNWQVGNSKFNLTALNSISAGSRLTRTDVDIKDNPDNVCTGIAKHSDCTFIKDSNNLAWGYIASYGKQSLAGDDLGLVIFYRMSDMIKTSEDQASYIVELKPTDGKVSYYFGAAWEKELNGIKTKDEFFQYLEQTAKELSTPVEIEL